MKAKIHSDCSSIVNVRTKPKLDSARNGKVAVGTTVEVKTLGKEWSFIAYKGKAGYVLNHFLVVEEK